jgi:hypothetical protein
MSHAFFSRDILVSSVVLVVACSGTVPLGGAEDASVAGSANTGGASAVTSGGSPAVGGANPTGGSANTGGTSSVTSSTLVPQCITVNGTLGWGIPGQPLICASNCTLCEAMCSYIGTKSEGWYSSCSGSAPQPAGCTSGSFLIQNAICGSG